MENKYFTPSIEDIRIGYECEMNGYLFLFDRGFQITYPKDDSIWEYGDLDMTSLHFLLSERNWNKTKLRVPYLTKEQIEAEGWEIIHRELKPKPYQVDWINAKKGDFTLWINLALHNSMHLGIDKINGVSGILFRGQCKDINTFRYICKLLNIK